MQQLLQSLKAGEMEIVDLPDPIPGKGEILIRTKVSAISAGTEGKTVSDARKGYVAKARARKEEVAKVISTAKSVGVVETYKMVMNKLESLQPLGYSSAGIVEAVGSGVRDFEPGNRVACGGSAASHAELVVVKENLVVHLPENVPMEEGAYATIGAIAMQGIRRADLRLGENAVVIGLGLIGQLTVRLLKAAGVRVCGVDIRPDLVEMALKSGADEAVLRSDDLMASRVQKFSNGFGTDAVIITAATSSLDPVELAGKLCRQRGKVVIVGSVPTGFNRKNYYRKELDLLMSTSYGPGRYDASYEEKGLDYPIGHVRWTENRNMDAFAKLLGERKLSVTDLISHRFAFENARHAFDAILNPEENTLGVVLEYASAEKGKAHKATPSPIVSASAVSVMGAGSFARNFLLPRLQQDLSLDGILTSRPHTAEDARRKFGFQRVCSSPEQLLESPGSAVVIATRHDSHAKLALQALRAGKRVFVEKPLCLNMDEYLELKNQLHSAGSPDLMVGFNRRFAPQIVALKKLFADQPSAIQYRINAGILPADHWVHDPEMGGGRLIGEACHFIDLCSFLASSPIKSVSAVAQKLLPQNLDTFVISLAFANGSVASVSYFSTGSKKMSKEYLEVLAGGVSAVMDDFKTLTIYTEKAQKYTLPKQDKGHTQEVSAFANSVKSGTPFPISVDDSLHATLATFAVLESLQRGGQQVFISEFEKEWISAKAN